MQASITMPALLKTERLSNLKTDEINVRDINWNYEFATDTVILYNFSERPFPGLNFATVFALIVSISPVLGLRPVLASLVTAENEPKPKISTF